MILKMLVFSDKNVYNFCSQDQFCQKKIFFEVDGQQDTGENVV